jgi:4-hydroxybenzoate polyprenyltransferase
MVIGIIKSMRPKQWTKNLLVFAALIFSEKLFDATNALRTLAAFVAFCLVSGAVYMVNDLVDRESDQRHPQKRLRPIASGRVKPAAAVVAAVFAVLLSVGGGFWLDWRFGAVVAGYLVMQLAYSFGLKRIVLLDVMVVAAGFVIRAVAGTLVVHVRLSPWLFVCTMFLALFLAIAKRRHELVNLEGGGMSHRSVLASYSQTLLDQMIAVATSAAVISYSIYTIAQETVEKFGTSRLMLTVPFVVFAVYRYLYLVYRREEGGAPEKAFLTDLPLIIDIVLYLVSVVAILYAAKAAAAVAP